MIRTIVLVHMATIGRWHNNSPEPINGITTITTGSLISLTTITKSTILGKSTYKVWGRDIGRGAMLFINARDLHVMMIIIIINTEIQNSTERTKTMFINIKLKPEYWKSYFLFIFCRMDAFVCFTQSWYNLRYNKIHIGIL